jgi:hypothetical protein
MRCSWTCTALALALIVGLVGVACAQAPGGQSSQQDPMNMPGMDMHPQTQQHSATTLIESIEQHGDSGTSLEPASSPHPMLMAMKGGWMFMLHGVAFLNLDQQTGPRGDDKIFSTNWLMGMAQHALGPGKLTLRAMLSLEPATITARRYPELFQQGETAFGVPLVDGQHPHDLFMELAGIYDLRLGERSLLSFYAAPVGDPAMGPPAYPHRTSAEEDPIAPLGHHLQDSTHIASDVLTAGFTYRAVRLEASGFHGREPNEQRWDIDQGTIDSWSTRLTVNPTANWSLQASLAYLTSPEALNPEQDVLRSTASVIYDRPLARGNWATTLLWGRNRTRESIAQVSNGYLLESTLRFARMNYVWGRIENVDRTNELLFDGTSPPPGFQEQPLARVQAYTLGYARDLPLIPNAATAVGAQLTLYSKPAFLDPLYGSHPLGAIVFLRIRPDPKTR